MAGIAAKLIEKLARRSRWVKKHSRVPEDLINSQPSFDFDKINKLEQVLQKSPGAYKLVRSAERFVDRNMGQEVLSQKPVISFVATAATMSRVGSTIVMTLPTETNPSTASLEQDIGIQPGDIIEILSGPNAGVELVVASLTNLTTIVLSDLPLFGADETGVVFRAILSNVVESFN